MFYFHGCSLLKLANKETTTFVRKHYIGRASTENFQKDIGGVLLAFDYHIKEYNNGPTSSYIISRWKIRDTSEGDSITEFKESKTRLIINGMIDNQSFDLNNGFRYDCFLKVENFAYNGSDFVPHFEDVELNKQINIMIEKFSSFLSLTK